MGTWNYLGKSRAKENNEFLTHTSSTFVHLLKSQGSFLRSLEFKISTLTMNQVTVHPIPRLG